MGYFIRIFCAFSFLLFSAQQAAQAAINDILPGDFYPSPAGVTTAAFYAYDRNLSGPYSNGEEVLDGKIDSQAVALRLTHAYDLGGTTLAAVAVLPWANAMVSPAPLAKAMGETQGLMDLRLGLTAWLINDPANTHYLAVSGMLISPTGHYDSGQTLNVGENRWKFALGGGWQKDIAPNLIAELSPELVWYGDNTDYAGATKLEQEPSYALTGYLRKRLSPAWHIHIGAQINRGGATRIDGVSQHNPSNNDRIMVGASLYLPKHYQLILRLAKDMGIDNGFRNDREVALRLLKSF